MQSFKLQNLCSIEVTEVLNRIGNHIGSLSGDYYELVEKFHESVYDHHQEDLVMDTMEKIVVLAVPEEGEIHPRRATFDGDWGSLPTIWFTSPGGVTVQVTYMGDDNFVVDVMFNRESTYLALCIIHELCVLSEIDCFHLLKEYAILTAQFVALQNEIKIENLKTEAEYFKKRNQAVLPNTGVAVVE